MNELSLLDSILNDVMGNGAGGCCSAVYSPLVDVKETKDAYVIEMELPGRSENEIEIQIDHNTLTVSSKKEEKEAAKNESKWLIKERRTASFKRSFGLPEDADQENTSAQFKNGILYVTLPRKEKAAAKRIEIKAA